MKKLFLLLFMWGIFLKAGFSPSTFIVIGSNSVTGFNIFRPVQYLSFFDRVSCFNSYYQTDSYQISSLRSYEAPIAIHLSFGGNSLICDAQQLFRLYNSYEWIRACDIEKGCLLLDMYLKPVRVTSVRLIPRPFILYRFTHSSFGFYNFFVTDLCINAGDYY